MMESPLHNGCFKWWMRNVTENTHACTHLGIPCLKVICWSFKKKSADCAMVTFEKIESEVRQKRRSQNFRSSFKIHCNKNRLWGTKKGTIRETISFFHMSLFAKQNLPGGAHTETRCIFTPNSKAEQKTACRFRKATRLGAL